MHYKFNGFIMFLSLNYYIFLIVVLCIYHVCNSDHKRTVLLIASYCAYLYIEPYLFYVLIIATLVCYSTAIFWDGKSNQHFKKHSISYGLFLLFSLLVFFKVNAFFVPAGHEVTGGYYNLLRPLGISFFTFQAAAYLLDVKRSKFVAEKSLLNIAVYTAFFPQLVCGPIERARRLMPQFIHQSTNYYQNFSKGIFYIACGLMYKFLIANNLGLFVDESLYNERQNYVGLILIVGVALFFFELYADFQAYTLIAIGSASLFGIKLSENFKRPICSKSLSDFWRRWHITLLHWLRDYIYAPIARMKILSSGPMKTVATFLVFMFFGLWHGIKLNFFVFGIVIFILSFYDSFVLTKPRKIFALWIQKKIVLYLGFASMFLLAAKDISHASAIFQNIFSLNFGLKDLLSVVGLYQSIICFSVLLILIQLDIAQEKFNQVLYEIVNRIGTWKKILLYSFCLAITLIFGDFGQKEFAYFGF